MRAKRQRRGQSGSGKRRRRRRRGSRRKICRMMVAIELEEEKLAVVGRIGRSGLDGRSTLLPLLLYISSE